jgi:hypothetical protein
MRGLSCMWAAMRAGVCAVVTQRLGQRSLQQEKTMQCSEHASGLKAYNRPLLSG